MGYSVMDYIFNGRTNILSEPLLPDGSLIVALHGGFGTPTDLQAKSNLEATFPNSYIIYVSADSSTTWKSGSKASDVAYIHSTIEKLFIDYPAIDATKVHLFGHSNGGMMVYKLAAYLDEFGFASITVISGCYVASDTFDYSGKVFHFHSANDQTVPIDGSVAGFSGIVYTIVKINEVHKNSVIRIGSSDLLPDADAHALDKIFIAFPDLKQDIKDHMGL